MLKKVTFVFSLLLVLGFGGFTAFGETADAESNYSVCMRHCMTEHNFTHCHEICKALIDDTNPDDDAGN